MIGHHTRDRETRTAVSTHHGEPTWLPNRKLIWGFGGTLALVLGVALLNHFVLGEADRVDLPASTWLAPFATALIQWFTAPSPHEGVLDAQ